MRYFTLLLLAALAMSATAKPKLPAYPLEYNFVDKFTDDALHLTYDSAAINVALNTENKELTLCILPVADTDARYALVDTAWHQYSQFQKGENVDNDLFRERNVTYLYTLTPDHYLACYYVLSHFIDKEHKGLQQIVIRKFDNNGKRLWCANINADEKQVKNFFDMLAYACKSLKFEKLTSLAEAPGASGLQRAGDHETNVVRHGREIGSGSPLKIGW